VIRGTHVDFPDGTKGQIEGEEGKGRRSGTPPLYFINLYSHQKCRQAYRKKEKELSKPEHATKNRISK